MYRYLFLSISEMNVLLLFVLACNWFEFATGDQEYRRLYTTLGNARGYGYEPQYSNTAAEEPEQKRIVYQPLGVVLLNKLTQLAHDDSVTEKLHSVYDKVKAQIEFARLFNTSLVADYISNLGNVQKLYDSLPEMPAVPRSFNRDVTPPQPEELPQPKELSPESEKSAADLKTPEETTKPNAASSYYDKFDKYYPWAKRAFSVGTYFVPGLGEYKALMLGLRILDTSWKAAKMYREGESWTSMAMHVGKSWFGLGRRDVTNTILSASAESMFIDVSSVNMETFLSMACSQDYPPLSQRDEDILKQDIADIIEQYLVPNDMKEDMDRYELTELFEKIIKFIALHGIIPIM